MPRLTIGRRFAVVALLVIPLVASVCVIGAIGVSRMNGQVTELYNHGYRHTLETARLSRAFPQSRWEGHETVPVREMSRGLEEFEQLRATGALISKGIGGGGCDKGPARCSHLGAL